MYPSIRVRTAPPVSVRVRNRVSVSFLFYDFCALKLIFKLISIADCAPSFELVRRRKYSEQVIFTARVAAIFTARRKYSLSLLSLSFYQINQLRVIYQG